MLRIRYRNPFDEIFEFNYEDVFFSISLNDNGKYSIDWSKNGERWFSIPRPFQTERNALEMLDHFAEKYAEIKRYKEKEVFFINFTTSDKEELFTL